MRLFLISFFSSPKFESKNYFYSHFYFVCQNKNLLVKIFLYNSKLQEFLNNYSFDNFLELGDFKKSNIDLVEANQYSIFFILFLQLILLKKDDSGKNFIFCEYNDNIFFQEIFDSNKLLHIKNLKNKNQRFFYLFFYSIIFYINKKININAFLIFLNFFLIQYFRVRYLLPVFTILQEFINNIFNYLFVLNSVQSQFYFISNNNMNAKFLARFIGKKLAQGNNITNIIEPVIRDLLVSTELKFFNRMGNMFKIKKIYKNLFLTVILNILKISIKIFNMFYIKKYSWVSLEIFCLRKNINSISINIKYFKYKNILNIYLNYQKYFYFLNIFDNFINIFEKKIDANSHFIIDNLINEIKFSNLIFLKEPISLIDTRLIFNAFFLFSKFLKYNYFKYNYSKLYKQISYKKLNMIDKNEIFLGFKFHFLGRFSRQDRASSI